jgi:hypothetical protein
MAYCARIAFTNRHASTGVDQTAKHAENAGSGNL